MNAAVAQFSARMFGNPDYIADAHIRAWGRGDKPLGGKKPDAPYSNTGERPEPLSSEKIAKNIAFIDFLTFTFSVHSLKTLKRADDLEEFAQLIESYFLSGFGLSYDENIKAGRNGYQHHWKILAPSINKKGKTNQYAEVGYFAYGGNNQTICISLTGQGCQFVGSQGFTLIREFLEDVTGKITRIDLAHDCLSGEVSLQDVRDWYDMGLFKANTRGRYPSKNEIINNNDSGNTVYVGSRESGKIFRAYEKGKQLGDKSSKWVRLELELHSTKRGIPYEILDRVSDYLAGAYDCLSLLSEEQSRIATQQKAESISFNHLEEYCRQSYGRFIEVMLSVYDGCPEIVVEKLRRDDALPARLIPSSIPIRE